MADGTFCALLAIGRRYSEFQQTAVPGAPRQGDFSGQWTMDVSGLLWTLVDDGLWTLVAVDMDGNGLSWTTSAVIFVL